MLIPLVLTGCGSPPAMTAMSFSLDGIAPSSTGDPVVIPNYSAGLASGVDGLIRAEAPLGTAPAAFGMLMGGAFGDAAAKPLSRPPAKAAPAAELPKATPAPAPQAHLKPAWSPPEDSADTLAAGRRAAKIAPAAGKEPAAEKKAGLVDPRVLVLGSYGKRANAARAALKWREMGATIVPSQVGAARLYRVVTAPVAGKDAMAELRRIRSIGVKGAWALRLCGGNDAKPGACVSLRASAAE